MSKKVTIFTEKNDDDEDSRKETMVKRKEISSSSSSSSSLSVPPPQGLFPLANSPQVATGSRQKVSLQPGYSLMNWIVLCKSGKDLAGTEGKLLSVTKEELSKHRRRDDAWMAINGKVFNVSAYMSYHPGGWDELMRGVGIDATDLFNEVHRWVNYESMLEACLVGKLCDDNMGILKKIATNKGLKNQGNAIMGPPKFTVIPPIGSATSQQLPRIDSYQTSTTFVLAIYTRARRLGRECIVVDLQDCQYLSTLVYNYKDGVIFYIKGQLENEASLSNVVVHETSGKVELHFSKHQSASWRQQSTNDFKLSVQKISQSQFYFVDYTLSKRIRVTHDVDHLVLKPPKNYFMQVPTGHHVKLKASVADDISIIRNYTPVPSTLDDRNEDKDEHLHLLVKTYADGALTPVLKTLSIGGRVKVSNHDGSFDLSIMESKEKCLMLAAGTGFTPMAKIVKRFRKTAEITLVFFNKMQSDIMWRDQLEALEHVKLINVLSDDPKWPGRCGRIDNWLIDDLVTDVNDKFIVLVCGPTQFSNKAERLLKSKGVDQNQIVVFKG